MKKFTEKMFKNFNSIEKPFALPEGAAILPYSLISHRWHFDTRPSTKIIAVHDYCSSNAYWHQHLNQPLADLPLERLTPSTPLDIYCPDLRGHNFSRDVPLTEGEYALLCAADVLRLTQEVTMDETAVCGVGLGALVVAVAALHNPEAFSHVNFLVQEVSDLFSCNCPSHPLHSVLSGVITEGATTVAELNERLKATLPNTQERALILSCCESLQGKVTLRHNPAVLGLPAISVKPVLKGAVYHKPCHLYVTSGKHTSPEEEALFKKHFPAGTIQSLSPEGNEIAYTLLRSLDILKPKENEF